MNKENIRHSIQAGSYFNSTFIMMNFLAAIIASYGLLSNSAAVVIGAMIVAMLVGPIMGISLGLVENDRNLSKQSLITLAGGIILVYVVAFVIGRIHIHVPLTDEIMARTSPNFMDLMVAIAGGAAGAYAVVSPRLSISVVGVAIATALVPPLCASSILLGRGETSLALGAFFLTFINIVAIQFAAATVLWVAGFKAITDMGPGSLSGFMRRNAVSLCLLVLLAIVLAVNLSKTASVHWNEARIHDLLKHEVSQIPGAYLAEVRFDKENDLQLVRAVLRSPQEPSVEWIKKVEDQIKELQGTHNVELRVRYVPVKIITSHGVIFGPD